MEREGCEYLAILLVNRCGGVCSILIPTASNMNTWGVLLKNSFFFRVQEWQLRVWKEKEKLRKFINLTLIYKILNKDNGSSMTMCIIIILGKGTSPDFVQLVGRSMRFPDKCVYQVQLQCYFVRSVASPVTLLHAHLTWWTCLANPSGGGRTGRGGSLLWIIKQKY